MRRPDFVWKRGYVIVRGTLTDWLLEYRRGVGHYAQ
jgi:hypothetical protein